MTTETSAPSLLLYYDSDKGTVLDRWTRKAYRSIGDRDEESGEYMQGGFWNTAAGSWASSLALSGLLEGEELPPEGRVGQYGRYGCVMVETSEGMWDTAEDVCIFPYDLDKFPQFLKELKQASGVRFRELDISVASASGMHGLSIGGHWVPAEELDDDEEFELHDRTVYEDETSKTDVAAALAWGRAHAEGLISGVPAASEASKAAAQALRHRAVEELQRRAAQERALSKERDAAAWEQRQKDWLEQRKKDRPLVPETVVQQFVDTVRVNGCHVLYGRECVLKHGGPELLAWIRDNPRDYDELPVAFSQWEKQQYCRWERTQPLIEIPEKIVEQFALAAQAGHCSAYDQNCVIAHGDPELVAWIQSHSRSDYGELGVAFVAFKQNQERQP